MDDIKTYIQGHLNTIKGLDMSDLIDTSGISRAKFYKCLREPWRFDDVVLERIAERMNMDECELLQLFAFKHASVEASNASLFAPCEELNQTGTDEKEKLYELVHRIIFGKNDIFTDCGRKVFTVFHEASSGLKNDVWSADEFASFICDDMLWDLAVGQRPQIDITICNSCTDDLSKIVYSLLQSLNKQVLLAKSDSISMTHFVSRIDAPLEEKLRIYAEWSGLMQYGRYELMFANPFKGSMFEFWNGVFIRYKDRSRTEKYLMVSIYTADNGAVFSFADNNLYEYFRYGVVNLFWKEDTESLLSTDALELSKRLVNCRATHPSIAFGEGVYLDHILPELYDEMIGYMLGQDSDWGGYDALLALTGAQGISNVLGKDMTVKLLVDGFKQRFDVSENAGTVNLLSAKGLRTFAETGQNLDMELVGISLNRQQRVKELKYLKEHLEGVRGGQAFYLINSMVVPESKIMYVIKGYRVAMVYSDTDAPAIYLKSQINWDTTDIFYDYIMNRLLSEERRNRPDSPIMSKEWAEEFIDNLIKEAEKEAE